MDLKLNKHRLKCVKHTAECVLDRPYCLSVASKADLGVAVSAQSTVTVDSALAPRHGSQSSIAYLGMWASLNPFTKLESSYLSDSIIIMGLLTGLLN